MQKCSEKEARRGGRAWRGVAYPCGGGQRGCGLMGWSGRLTRGPPAASYGAWEEEEEERRGAKGGAERRGRGEGGRGGRRYIREEAEEEGEKRKGGGVGWN
ncbi:hypothetical protein E2C01_095616 [Portunus trituberculatus]|uniref:Uncharacterized protein n=1 Tax=Portunus trituberculatus TaxID=210409 RepID=A0A5B7JZB1_PORTR|nr:hypothetical protein [Portunus trituberculatus]